MKYVFLFIALLTIAGAPATAQQMDEVRKVSGRVADAFTHEPIENVSICLLAAADSSLLATYQPVGDDTLTYRHFGMFSLPVKEKGKYLIRTSCIGYKTVYTPFEVKYKREGDIWLKRIDMKRESKVLNEVTVTGTKIKMVLRGDTVVYNADAFNLAEGSMLDALIRQLPGAELNKDGEIKVNGKKIDNLLVDGRDFFEGDPKAALENLPAYTVNKIKVFDRKGKLTQMMGRDMDDKSYVMDVRLKKQYASSTFGNVEAGGGTDHRWGVKGMANRRADKHQLSVAANLNNMNDQNNSYIMFGGGGISVMGYQPESAKGVNTYRTANVGYSYGNWEDKFSAGLSLNGSHNDSHTDTWTSSQTYLTGGDTYSRQANYARNRSRSLGGYAHMNWSPEGLVSSANISMNYSDGLNWGNNRSAQFDADPAEYGDLLDDLFLHPDKYRSLTMNRRSQQSQGDNRSLSLNGGISADVKIMADVITLRADGSYSHSKQNSYQLSDVYYMKGGSGLPGVSAVSSASGESRDFRNQYTYAPNTNWNAQFGADYNYGMGRHNLRLTYNFFHSYTDGENSLYRLDRLEASPDPSKGGEMCSSVSPPLEGAGEALLPSTREALLSVLDAANSYTSTRHDNQQSFSAQLRIVPRFLGDGAINLTLPVVYRHNTLDYYRQTSQHQTQDYWAVNPNLRVEYAPKRGDKQKMGVQGQEVTIIGDTRNRPLIRSSIYATLNTSVPDIMSLVSYRDDSDPLHTSYSNPDLKKTRTLNVGADYMVFGGSRQKNMNVGLTYSRTFDAVATSMVYDKATGATVTKPENVNGNWNLSGNFGWGQSLDEKRTFSFQNDLNGTYSHSVDLNSVAGMESQHSTVHNTRLTERLYFTWRFASKKSDDEFTSPQNSELNLSVSGTYNHVDGDRQDFQRVNAGNFSIGGSLLLQLPWDFELNTTLTNYSRRGYSDPQMNTNELIWGARLTRRFLKGSLLLTLEGFDLLGQLSNRSYNINEQGRTETYTNVISQYALLKISYQFHRFPKGRGITSLFF